MMDKVLESPPKGDAVVVEGNRLVVHPNPIIPYIRGDGIGVDVTPVMLRVVDAAVERAYEGEREISWMRVLAGEDAVESAGLTPEEVAAASVAELIALLLPRDTLEAISRYKVAIKGPLTTPVGEGFRSLNVSLRQLLDLYACVRPVRWYPGVPAPLRHPERLDVVIFRENIEDVYAGIEWREGSPEAERVRRFLTSVMGVRIRKDSAIGIKPVSVTGSKRLVRAAINYSLANGRRSVTLVHKGNIMKFTEGAFRNWGYEVAIQEFRDSVVTEDEQGALRYRNEFPGLGDSELLAKLRESGYYGFDVTSLRRVLDSIEESHGGSRLRGKLLVKDRIADQMFQQLLLRPEEYDVIATLNLNGDYLSDSCAAEVGGLGIAPGANINYETGIAVFEATHGSAPKHAGLDRVNPSSMILSAVLMLGHMGWGEAASMLETSLQATIANGTVTYDLHRQMEGGTLLSTSEFGEAIVEHMIHLSP
jgi:isocitrate dehydrogenase